MKNLLSLLLVIVMCSGCDFTTPTPPPSKGNQPNSRWQADNGGVSNITYYLSKTTLPAGVEIRIQVVTRGRTADIKLVDESSNKTLREWSFDSMANEQVLSYKLAAPAQPYILVGGPNFCRDIEHISEDSEIDTMRFAEGWELKVRLVKPQL